MSVCEVEGFRVGDKVSVIGKIGRFEDRGIAVLQVEQGYRVDVHIRYLTLVERPEPDPEVGDCVFVPWANETRVIRAIVDDVWVTQSPNGGISLITPVERTHCRVKR